MEKATRMKTPLNIHFEGLDPSEFIENRVREEVDKLEHFFDKIISCRVVVEKPHKHHHKGNLHHLRIDVTVPGGEIVVKRSPDERQQPPRTIAVHSHVYASGFLF